MTVRHSNQTEVEGIHQPFNWIFADATERNAETGMAADDINKIALQEDTSTSYILTDLAPTWEVLTSGGGYPFDIISVDASDPDADYSDMSSAIAAASSGDLIVVGPGTYTCDAETVPAGVALIGQGAGVTILQTTSATRTLTTSGYILNVSVIGNVASGEIHALTLNDGAEARGAVGDATSGDNSDTVRGIHVTGSASLWQCEGYADGGTFSFGLYGNGYQDACYVYGGRFSGINGTSDNGDIQDGDEQRFRLSFPIAVNGNVDVANGSGWYLDESANMAQASISSGASPYVGADRILDEDTMTSDSDTALATQQSIKAYVDAAASGAYPFTVITVDATNASADYSDLASAVAAANSGDVIVVGPGTYTANELTAPATLYIVGSGIFSTTIENDDATAAYNIATSGNLYLYDLYMYCSSTNAGDNVSPILGTSSVGIHVYRCALDGDNSASSGAQNSWVFRSTGGGDVYVWGSCWLSAYGNGTNYVADGFNRVYFRSISNVNAPSGIGDTAEGFYIDQSNHALVGGAGGVGVTQILDEDTMASDSDEVLATQQSIKAYVDASSIIQEGNSSVEVIDAGTGSVVVTVDASQVADLTSAGLRLDTGGVRVSTILNEDNMASNSDVALSTQQSIKAYVDASIGSAGDYPFNIISVDATDPDADYSDIASAVGAASSGSVIVVGPGSYAVADIDLTTKDLTFIGQTAHGAVDGQRTAFDAGAVTTSLFKGGGTISFHNIFLNGATDTDLFNNASTVILVNCTARISSNSGTNYLVSGSSGAVVRVYSGRLEGAGTASVALGDSSGERIELVGMPHLDTAVGLSASTVEGFFLRWDIATSSLEFTGSTGGVGVDRILDEDNMASDSAEALATQQSIKAYADGKVDKSGDTMAGSLSLGGNELQNFTEQIVTATTGASYDIDWAAATLFELTLDNSPTITFSNLASGRSITLVLIQAGGGSQTVSWPASVDWPGGTAPTLSTAAGAVDVLTMFVRNDGTTVLGFEAGLDMQ